MVQSGAGLVRRHLRSLARREMGRKLSLPDNWRNNNKPSDEAILTPFDGLRDLQTKLAVKIFRQLRSLFLRKKLVKNNI